MGFQAAPFREALSCSLDILGAEPLAETTDEEGRRVWTFPPLDRRAETDPSWASTLDTLRAPRKSKGPRNNKPRRIFVKVPLPFTGHHSRDLCQQV